jgi:predicted ATP-grasp superfamily ATP-dependent carboligase
MTKETHTLPPAIILGGTTNALSVARSLGRAGVKVHAINWSAAPVRYSRYCHWLPVPWNGNDQESWARYLLGPESNRLGGAVLLAASDQAIELIADHRERLEARFILDESNRDAQRCMLNKLATYQQAVAAGVATPRFWTAATRADILVLRDELVFPLLVKPHFAHRFGERLGESLGKRFALVQTFDQLLTAHQAISEAGIDAMLVEVIPSPDDRLCSYYTYLDEESNPLFHFTKRVIRKFPAGRGDACYHITDWNPEVRDLGLRLFRQVRLRGLANVEFIRDDRDGQLKLIECNARFTAANSLVADSGCDLARFVYFRLIGRPVPPPQTYAQGKRLWYPVQDFKAFRELRAKNQLTFWRWLGSLAHRKILPYFRWSDPLPTIVNGLRAVGADIAYCRVRHAWRRALHHLRRWAGSPSDQTEPAMTSGKTDS